MPRPDHRRPALALAALTVVLGTALSAEGAPPAVERSPTAFRIGQLHYGGGGDWYANPSSLPNLARELHDRAGMEVESEIAHPAPLDDDLFACPFIHMTGHGNVHFTDEEVERMRWYFTHGGFLWADDNYGMDQSFRREMRRILPDDELVEVPFDHDIYHQVYDFPKGLPKVHEHDGGPPKGYAIFHDGRMVVFYTYDTDIGDGIENADVHGDPPDVRELAMKTAINVVSYALTH